MYSRGAILAYCGEPQAAVEHMKGIIRFNPLTPDIFRENLAEAYYPMRDYDNALDTYLRWQNPPVHSFTHVAASYAQLGRMDEAYAAAQTFKESCPPEASFSTYAEAHARICKRPEDAEHWLEGYRKAGLMA